LLIIINYIIFNHCKYFYVILTNLSNMVYETKIYSLYLVAIVI
jgi:hypothetical protein